MAQENRGRLIEDSAWLVLSLAAALILRRDLRDANDLQIEIGRSIAFTAAMMVFPTYAVSLGIGSLIGFAMRRTRVDRILQPIRSTVAERVLEIAFLGVGVWTVGMIATIDIFAGIMALIVLFSHVLINDFGRLPGGAFLSGCATWIVGIQLLFIGGTLLTVYSAQPFGEGIGIGPIVAMLAPGLRMIVSGIISLVGTFQRAKKGGLAGTIEEVSGVDVDRLKDFAASIKGDPDASSRVFASGLSPFLAAMKKRQRTPRPARVMPAPAGQLSALGAELESRIASGDPHQAPTEAELGELTRLAEQYQDENQGPAS